jgi:DNA-binding GntR family transcriptional regulator
MAAPARSSLRHRIADELRERLEAGEFLAGARLPSEPELARMLGVSRGSVRSAIALLEADGLLRRMHGSGTFVTDRPLLRNDLSQNFGVSELIAGTGLHPGTVEARAAREPAPADVADAFGIQPGTPLSALYRVRTASGRRVVQSVDWCREEMLDPSELSALGHGSVYAALGAQGITVHHGVASISPTVAAGETARRLKVPAGTLLITLFQVDSTVLGEVVLVSLEHHLPDAFQISVYRRGPGEVGAGEQWSGPGELGGGER